jgi:hypothetical protein
MFIATKITPQRIENNKARREFHKKRKDETQAEYRHRMNNAKWEQEIWASGMD